MSGQIRVGRCTYPRNGGRNDPSYPGFTPIVVLTKSSKYGSLSPYVLKDAEGRIMENLWQGSKVYPDVPYSLQKRSRFDSTVIWEYPAEKHAIYELFDNGFPGWKLLPEYYVWRKKLMETLEPVRYPVGYHHRSKCIFAVKELPDGSIEKIPLDYIQGRKEIFLPLYTQMVVTQDQILALQKRWKNGENLLIVEVDGPHQESLEYYQEKYNVQEAFIQQDTVVATKDNLQILLEDSKHNFGHGYCLASALQELQLV